MNQGLKIGGYFRFECLWPDGQLAWRKRVKNGIVNTALTDVLSVYLGAGTQKTTWFMGLINNSGYVGIAAGDTIASHTGWTELTDYDEATRVTMSFAAAASQLIALTTPCQFTISATVTVKGAFIVSNSTKGGTTGTLFAHGEFDANQSMSDGQVLNVNYDCAASNV